MPADMDEFTEDDRKSWAARGRYDARREKPALMYVAANGQTVLRGDPPDDWSDAYAKQAARAYYDAWCRYYDEVEDSL